MADYGAKIAKQGFDAEEFLTEQTKKNYIILSSADAHKIVFAGFVTGGTHTHNLGYEPFYDVFEVDTTQDPNRFRASNRGAASTTTISNLPSPCYLIVYNEGNK